MRGLFLCGFNSTQEIWKEADSFHLDYDLIKIDYPREVTMLAHHIKEISDGIASKVNHQHYDFVNGHSMGGIIALQLVKDKVLDVDQIILTETSLIPAGQLYRDLFYKEPQDIDWYFSMLQNEEFYYREELIKRMQGKFDYQDLIREVNIPIHGIYGDRGTRNYDDHIQELHLAADINSKIDFHFIRDCGHLPMLENPKEYYEMITYILSTYNEGGI